jgi:hypothetical protein
MNALVEQFQKHGFILEVNEDRIVARCDRVSPRASSRLQERVSLQVLKS